MVSVDDVRMRQCPGQGHGDRVSAVAGPALRAQNAHLEAARLAERGRRPESDEPALHTTGEGPPELERVTLAAPEDSVCAERGRRDLHHPHLVLCLVTVGHPERLTGGYLYHLRMAEAAPAHGARIVFVSFPDRTFPLAALAAPRVFNRVRSLRPQAVLLDSIAAASAGPWLAAHALGAPLIGVLHQTPGGIDHGRWRIRLQAPLDLLAYRKARKLIVASDFLADQLTAEGVDRERIQVVPPGRDVAAATSTAHDMRRGRGAALLCVANWMDRKGILELLDAFARIPAETATLHLAGDDRPDTTYAARVRRRLSEPDVAARVVVHGPLSRDRVAALYAGADVFVLPAFREPYGTVWGEAMSFGLPVAGWRADNLPYLAEDGREALMVPPGDVAGLARALHALATDEALRGRLGEAARRRASTRPTWEQSAQAFFREIRAAV